MITSTLHAAKWSLLSFRRNPAATFFTIIFPILFLVIFASFSDDEARSKVVPGLLGLSIVSATFVNLAMSQVRRRESGQLKRLRGTPLSPLSYNLGHGLSSLVIVAVMTVVVTAIGLLFGVDFNLNSIGVFIATVALGSIAFSALGLAATAIIPNDDAAPAITNAIVFPLYFISDVFFFSNENSSGFVSRIGDFFPVKPLVESLQPSYGQVAESISIPWAKWAVIAAWGVFGLIAASRFFLWVPQTERR